MFLKNQIHQKIFIGKFSVQVDIFEPMELLKELTAIRGVSSDESTIASFIVNYCKKNAKNWKVEPKIIFEENFRLCHFSFWNSKNCYICDSRYYWLFCSL